MVEIEKTASPLVTAVQQRTTEADGIVALAQLTGGNPAKSVEFNGVTVRSDRIAVAAGARLGTQLSELRQLAANATAGASLLDIAESGLSQIDSKLVRMDALARTAALTAVERLDGSSSAAAEISAKDRAILGSEFAGLREDIDDIAAATKFNGVALLSGSAGSPGAPKVIDFGASTAAGETVIVSLDAADVASLSSDLSTANLDSQAGGEAAVTAVAAAQGSVDDIRAAVRGARAQLNSGESASADTSAVVERVQAMKTAPEKVVDLSRVVASQVTEESGLRIQDGAQQLLQDVLLRMSAATANGGPAAGSDTVEEFGGKTAGAPAAAAQEVETADNRGDDAD